VAVGLAVVTDRGTQSRCGADVLTGAAVSVTGRQSRATVAGALLGGTLSASLLACGGAASGDAAATDSAAIAAGRDLYRVHGCAVCHGEHGRGDGPVGRTLRPPPRDFQRPETFRAPRTVSCVAAVIANGGGTPSSGMPAFAHLGDASRQHLARFVLSLGKETRESK
jgi:mono/diheme cytochrome c family protein